MIVSHGHIDHYGGLIGFLEKHRGKLPADVKLYAGGEDNFCHRVSGTPTAGQFAEFGTLDRREIVAQKVSVVLCETPTVIAGHAFTTGKITRNSMERLLPNSFVDYSSKEAAGCDYGHYTAAELQGKIVPDQHVHEHATCFNIRGKGSRGDLVLRPCRDRQLGAAGAAGVRHPESACDRRRLPSRVRRRPTTSRRWSPRSRSLSRMCSSRCIAAA